MGFKNREAAGEKLAEQLKGLRLKKPIVLALPRGGVPVAAKVAARIGAPLDVLVVRKIGAPDNPEYGIGAITEGGHYWLNEEAVKRLGIPQSELESVIQSEMHEVQRRVQTYRKEDKSGKAA